MKYLSKIHIDLARIEGLQRELNDFFNKLSTVADSLSSTKSRIDYKICARRNIGHRLNQSSMKLKELEGKLNRIKTFVQFAVDKYNRTEEQIAQLAPRESRKLLTDLPLIGSAVSSVIRSAEQQLRGIHELAKLFSDLPDRQTIVLKQASGTHTMSEQRVSLLKRTAISWTKNISSVWKRFVSVVGSIEGHAEKVSEPSIIDMLKGLFLQAKKWYLMEKLKSFQSDPQIASLLEQLKHGTLADQKLAMEQLGKILFAIQGISRSQVAYEVYSRYGNEAYMAQVHEQAEGYRTKLKELGISDALLVANLAAHYIGSVLSACAYDPRLSDGSAMPTVLWGSEDGKLSADKQLAILQLTDKYFLASFKEQREEILRMVSAIRDGSLSPNTLLGNQMDAASVSAIVQRLMSNPSVFMETIQSIGQDSMFAIFANANLHEQGEAVSQAMKGLNESLAYAVYTKQMEDMIDRFNKEVSEKDITKMQELLSKMKIYDGPISGTYNVDFMYAVFFYQHLVDTHYFDKVNVDGKVTEALIRRAIVDDGLGREITWIDPDAPTGTYTISAIAQGFSLSMAHSASGLSAMFPWDPYFYTETVPGLIQFGKMVKDGEFKELGNALAEEYIQPLKEVERMADKVLSGKATYEEAHQFGQNLAKVLEGVAAIGSGATAAIKAVKTLKNLFRKGKGEGGVGATGEGIPIEKVKPKVLDEIYPDPSGAYGYLPKEGTAYSNIDFTDVNKAKENQLIRKEYLEQTNKIEAKIADMTAKGSSTEEIAKTVVEMRNQDKVAARTAMSTEEVVELEKRNIKKYGNPIGPDADWLYQNSKIKLGKINPNVTDKEVWEAVIEGVMRKDEVINTLLGIEH